MVIKISSDRSGDSGIGSWMARHPFARTARVIGRLAHGVLRLKANASKAPQVPRGPVLAPELFDALRLRGFPNEVDVCLLQAVSCGDAARCHELVQEGAGPNANVDGTTPLLAAIRAHDLTLCKMMIDLGARLRYPSEREGLGRLLHEAGILAESSRQTFLTPRASDPKLFIAELAFLDAISRSDVVRCRALVQQGVDPNANVDGTTPLIAAIRTGDLATCKAMIDLGAKVQHPSEQGDLKRLLATAGIVSDFATNVFLTPRPAFYDPQILIDGAWRSLRQCAESYLQDPRFQGKEVCLINETEENFNKYYGGVSRKLLDAYLPAYDEVARHFTVVVVLVDRTDRLGEMIDLVKRLLPTLPIAHWALDGHGNISLVDLGKEEHVGELSIESAPLMQPMANKLDFSTTLSIWACDVTAGEGVNLVSVLSGYAGGRMFSGADCWMQGVVLKVYYSEVLQKYVVVPFFEREGLSQVKIYADRKFVAQSDLTGDCVPPELIEILEKRFAFQRGTDNRQSQ